MAEEIKVGVVSLGCPKNQCDAELMLAEIAKSGYKIVPEAGLADVVVINTCGFIQSAKEEAIEEILEAVSRKNDGINKKIIVTGCLAERYREQMDEEFPEVDAVLGIGSNGKLAETIRRVMKGERVIDFGEKKDHTMEGERLLSTLPHYAYLRIADGCDNCCTYCAIPEIRGKFRSRTIENIMDEAEKLVKSGVKELILVAQDTTRYGEDLYGRLMLPELLKKLCSLDVKWIRLLYCYPERMTDELIETIAREEKICKYIDLPLQHCNGEILRDMNREGDRASLTALIKKLRERIAGLTLRTTLLVGFPGETEEQFTELAEFAHEIRFERLGCFAYSAEEGTPAADYPNQVADAEKEHRAELIMEQQEIRVSDDCAARIGRETEVVVEGYDRYSELFFGRDESYAPEIDGMIYFTSAERLSLGRFVRVRITDVMENNLLGEVVC
ncbi:MAG: 30S ribosomal protein S12 methylthiotransferase RimO [Bacteroides sp.]|nr:30S ribosomal protein S12 methylthiotransferase RimO [Eubacterium sp.]MCM1418426.1 30S ribosomal protein S12 methylthiotransferase RimO [Roseburia sp.]MCM1461553.1 30S ribosomal protein S12 methylthiotransferase RimO [Bacteroides sp.]